VFTTIHEPTRSWHNQRSLGLSPTSQTRKTQAHKTHCSLRYYLALPKHRQATSQCTPPNETISPPSARHKQSHCLSVYRLSLYSSQLGTTRSRDISSTPIACYHNFWNILNCLKWEDFMMYKGFLVWIEHFSLSNNEGCGRNNVSWNFMWFQ